MSILSSEFWFIQCDSCNDMHEADSDAQCALYPTKSEAKQAAKDAGWLLRDDAVLCPNCRPGAKP